MDAFIMTGGKGLRLAPYTDVLPKGLLPVGGRPMLHWIVSQLTHHGVQRITMACGHLAELIQTYFGDGSRYDVEIRYFVEDKPLGTAGALRLIDVSDEPFLVLNCDLLTTLDFSELMRFHRQHGGLLTVASHLQVGRLEYGTLVTQGDRVVHYLEKPMQTAVVGMGVYVLSPDCLKYLPSEDNVDMPQVIEQILDAGQPVYHFANDAYWLDIGRPSDFKKANEDIQSIVRIAGLGDGV